MSTILKALRRLEEEDSKTGSTTRSKDVVIDSAAAAAAAAAAPSVGGGVLRDRILAEEAAAHALEPEPTVSNRRFQIGLVATVASVALAALVFGVNAYLESDGAGRIRIDEPGAPIPADAATARAELPSVAEAPNRPAPAIEAPTLTLETILAADSTASAPGAPTPSAVAVETQAAPAAPQAPAAKTRRGTAEKERANRATAPIAPSPSVPIVAVVDDAAAGGSAASNLSPTTPPPSRSPMTESSTQNSTQSSTERSTAASTPVSPEPERSGLARAAVTPTPAAASRRGARSISSLPEASPESIPKADPPRSANSVPSSSPTSAKAQVRDETSVDRIDHRGLPDVVVLRTSWHPKPERRSARIRLVTTNETLNLREGDAVGGLVIEEITPSSVLFHAGDVEIRRKVGSAP